MVYATDILWLPGVGDRSRCRRGLLGRFYRRRGARVISIIIIFFFLSPSGGVRLFARATRSVHVRRSSVPLVTPFVRPVFASRRSSCLRNFYFIPILSWFCFFSTWCVRFTKNFYFLYNVRYVPDGITSRLQYTFVVSTYNVK